MVELIKGIFPLPYLDVESEKTVILPSLNEAVPRRRSVNVAVDVTLLPERPKNVGLAGDHPILRGRNQEPRRGRA